MEEITEGGAKHKTKGALEGVKDTAKDVMSTFSDDDDDDEDERPRRRATGNHGRRPAHRGR
jgi:hypothetical protein